jgi:hypothetical protein
MERADGKAAGDDGLYNLPEESGWQMGARPDAIPNAAGGEGGHGAATPDGATHTCLDSRFFYFALPTNLQLIHNKRLRLAVCFHSLQTPFNAHSTLLGTSKRLCWRQLEMRVNPHISGLELSRDSLGCFDI